MDEVPTGDVRCQLRLAVLRCPGHGQFSRGSFSSSIRFKSAMISDRIAVMRSISKTRLGRYLCDNDRVRAGCTTGSKSSPDFCTSPLQFFIRCAVQLSWFS